MFPEKNCSALYESLQFFSVLLAKEQIKILLSFVFV